MLCAAVGVVIAAVVRPTRTSARGGTGGGVVCVPLFCLSFYVPACPRFTKHWRSSILVPLDFSRL